ncbi:MAG: trypsin-like peptidase domain-containing protein [Pseudomonadota bacterium]
MADHFLTKTRIELGQCLEFGEGLALDAYPALHEALKAKAGPEAARLFAEPLLSRGNDSAPASVSWYTDAEGSGQPFNRLDDAAQSGAASALSRQLAEIGPLIDDPDVGALVSAAMHLRDPDDIWVVGGRPVIINWGMLPADQARDASSRKAQYEKTFGRFLPLAAAPPLTTAERDARSAQLADAPRANAAPGGTAAATAAGVGAATGAAASTAAETAEASTPPPPPPPRRAVPAGAWIPLVLLLLLAGGTLAWLLVPGNRIFQERRADAVSTEEAAALAAAVNQSLEERVVALRAALDGAVCTSDGTLLMPDGVTIEGLLPPDDLDPLDRPGEVRIARPRSILPPAAERVEIPVQGGFAETSSLLQHIEERTGMVLVQGSRGLETGTGFFVAPDLLVTNYHVVESAVEGGIYVTNQSLASLKNAELVKALGPMNLTGGDFALLRIPGASEPSFQVLVADQSLRLQSVIAAGYPGDLLRTDQQFLALRSGNLDAVPELSVTDGTITTEQRFNAATEVIVHSAPISTGNSGGPLIDMCGRLIGMNTFVVQGPLRNLNFALSGGDLIRFLEGTAALPTVVTSECVPRIERPSPPVEEAAVQEETEQGTLPPLNLPKIEN